MAVVVSSAAATPLEGGLEGVGDTVRTPERIDAWFGFPDLDPGSPGGGRG